MLTWNLFHFVYLESGLKLPDQFRMIFLFLLKVSLNEIGSGLSLNEIGSGLQNHKIGNTPEKRWISGCWHFSSL